MNAWLAQALLLSVVAKSVVAAAAVAPRPVKTFQVREPVMNWVYWLSGIAAVGIFVYLVIALFKPEFFE